MVPLIFSVVNDIGFSAPVKSGKSCSNCDTLDFFVKYKKCCDKCFFGPVVT